MLINKLLFGHIQVFLIQRCPYFKDSTATQVFMVCAFVNIIQKFKVIFTRKNKQTFFWAERVLNND